MGAIEAGGADYVDATGAPRPFCVSSNSLLNRLVRAQSLIFSPIPIPMLCSPVWQRLYLLLVPFEVFRAHILIPPQTLSDTVEAMIVWSALYPRSEWSVQGRVVHSTP